jgi:hypothetical protein
MESTKMEKYLLATLEDTRQAIYMASRMLGYSGPEKILGTQWDEIEKAIKAANDGDKG